MYFHTGFTETILFDSWKTTRIPSNNFKVNLINILCTFCSMQFLLAHVFLYLFWRFYTKELESFVNI